LPGVWLAWSVLAFIVAIMSFVWRTGAQGDSNLPLPTRQEFGPRIGITCQLVLGLVYFALVIRTFRSYGESGRKARVVRRMADVQLELDTRGRWEGERGRVDIRSRAIQPESEDDARERGRGQANDSATQTEKQMPNELGLSGMDRKQDVIVTEDREVPVNESFSSLGM
jgi:hypothetical protein